MHGDASCSCSTVGLIAEDRHAFAGALNHIAVSVEHTCFLTWQGQRADALGSGIETVLG